MGAARSGPVGEFCAKLDELRIHSGADVPLLARRLGLSRAQLYAILAGKIERPPDWDRVVRPLVDACTGGDPGALTAWRQRHAIVTGVWEELRRRDRPAEPAARKGRAGPRVLPDKGAGPSAIPRELPPAVAHFTGRTQELATLTELLDRRRQQVPGTVVISAIGGTAGVGKTALAVHWAHQAAERFPDGQLYVNLRGYDPGRPVAAADALAGFLRSLGVPGPDIPPEEEQRAARYRSLLAGKQMLIVLDNAGSAEQVRPLLPGTPASTVLVTSRDALAGLVAGDGVIRLDLDLLPLEEAVALLRTLIGARADTDPAVTQALAERCCRLPLTLRVAAEHAAAHPAMPLAALAGELADLRTRLVQLETTGDPRTQVRTVFSWSYRNLAAQDARAFRLLGLHPGPDFELYAAAALTGTNVPQARRAVDALARAYLIQPAAPGRYGMHDLLRGYARELSGTVDGEEEQHAAQTRLFDYYLYTTATAMDTLLPAGGHRHPRIPRPGTPVPPLADPAAAREWLYGERAVLVTVAHGYPGHATRLDATLSRYLRHGAHFPEAITIFSHVVDAARRTGDRAAEATALFQLGNVDLQQSRLQQAADHYRQALTLFGEAGDQAGEAQALCNLGLAETQLGRHEQAARHQHEAIAIFRATGNRLSQAHALSNLGLTWQRQGRFQEAAGYYQQGLDLFREIGDREGIAFALGSLGVVDLWLGRSQHATGYLQQALDLFQEMGHATGECEALARLGEAHAALGRYEQAAGNFEQSLTTSREIGAQVLEAGALNGLGDVLFQAGDEDKARVHYASALRLASEAGSPREQARAHSGLARAYHASGDPVQARHHWQEALTSYTAIGAPETDEIRARLAGLCHAAGYQAGRGRRWIYGVYRPCLLSHTRHVSATSRQPWSMVREWPRSGNSSRSVTAEECWYCLTVDLVIASGTVLSWPPMIRSCGPRPWLPVLTSAGECRESWLSRPRTPAVPVPGSPTAGTARRIRVR